MVRKVYLSYRRSKRNRNQDTYSSTNNAGDEPSFLGPEGKNATAGPSFVTEHGGGTVPVEALKSAIQVEPVIVLHHRIQPLYKKRGLPHAHMLLILRNIDKLREIEDVDALVSAEIPDPQTNSRLYNIVKNCMIHGPCGTINPKSPCMEDEHCTRRFPKEFADETSLNVNGYRYIGEEIIEL
ncbi:unnamed protein product [Nezara viridula]|uniref:Uncharacterized protein n=1 Tax=Nezara viridula TaxID=85310 RepID=A0A9P0E518_NEZVI|nr:unnamed protein product [Nezara viridula]